MARRTEHAQLGSMVVVLPWHDPMRVPFAWQRSRTEVDIAVNIPPHLADIIAHHPKLFLSTGPSTRTIQLLYYTHQYDAQHKLVGHTRAPPPTGRYGWP
jgi:hypothetical protein